MFVRETVALALERAFKEEQLYAIEKFVSGQDVCILANRGSLHDFRSIAKHSQRCYTLTSISKHDAFVHRRCVNTRLVARIQTAILFQLRLHERRSGIFACFLVQRSTGTLPGPLECAHAVYQYQYLSAPCARRTLGPIAPCSTVRMTKLWVGGWES